MNIANYLSVSQNPEGNGCYPMSAQGFEFIQEQVLLLQKAIAAIAGHRLVIIKKPTDSASGLVMIDGEILPLMPCNLSTNGTGVIIVVTQSIDIVADGVTYTNARVVKYAEYSNTLVAPPVAPPLYMLSDFSTITPITQLQDQ